jgi:superfamily II DNA or RNA helicase
MSVAKVIVKDEVNVKIEGLDLSLRKSLMKKFEFEEPGARFRPAFKLGRWNGKVTYFTLGGSTYINLLSEILPLIEEAGYEIELEDHRTYQTSFDFTQVDENTLASHAWPQGHEKAGQPIVLRDYQIKVINEFLTNPQSIQEVATGAGKTITTAALSYSVQNYGRSLVIVPTKTLVVQTEEDYKNVGLDVGVYFGDRKDYNKTHTICTWQSLNKLLEEDSELTLEQFAEGVVCIIVDEVHSAKASVLKSMLTGALSKIPIRWGLTGTIPKSDYEALALFVSIGNLTGKLTARELQERGVLANCHVNIVQLCDNGVFKNYQSELKFLLEYQPRLDKIAELINGIRTTGNTLVLVDRIGAGKDLLSKIPDSVFVSGETSLTERREEYAEIKTSDNKVIVATYGVASVGINIPRIFNLVLIEPGKSFVRVIQSIGRGIRKAEDKDSVEIWDIASTCKFAKRHLTQRKSFYKEAKYPFTLEKLRY